MLWRDCVSGSFLGSDDFIGDEAFLLAVPVSLVRILALLGYLYPPLCPVLCSFEFISLRDFSGSWVSPGYLYLLLHDCQGK